jgi:hypothetical protein
MTHAGNYPPAPKKGLRATEVAGQKGRIVMTMITSESLSPIAGSRDGSSPFAELRTFWRRFFTRAFNPYRPELHYMRGPGPAWRAKHMAVSPAVHSMVAEIRASKARRSPARA